MADKKSPFFEESPMNAPQPQSPWSEETRLGSSGSELGNNVAAIACAFSGLVVKHDGEGSGFVVKFDQPLVQAGLRRAYGYASPEGVKEFSSVHCKVRRGTRVVGHARIDDRDLALITSIGLDHVGRATAR
jgi:hypothetical protein